MGTINDYIAKNEADLNIIIDGPGCFGKIYYTGPLGGVPENLRGEEVLAKSWSIGHQMHVLTINPAEEDKQAILNALLPALQKTRAGKDVVKLIYDKDSEKVWIDYVNGIDAVNVRADSGAAMLVDVLRAVMYS